VGARSGCGYVGFSAKMVEVLVIIPFIPTSFLEGLQSPTLIDHGNRCSKNQRKKHVADLQLTFLGTLPDTNGAIRRTWRKVMFAKGHEKKADKCKQT